ncbi:MAG: epoxyqueuosine reductase [Clostridiales bacterium]|jgi:epoxyqueuosine reductase QueG|nr:epoxyqueuosine reductase [Clostridiales bacterium]
MNKDDIVALAQRFIEGCGGNYIAEESALHPRCVGMKIFEAPIFAFGPPHDGLYAKYAAPDVIGSHFLGPDKWLPNTKTVISFFLPYADKIKAANSSDSQWPAYEWLHGRYEGQHVLKQLLEYLVKTLSEAGHDTLAPSIDRRFKAGNGFKHTSNWSERHIAYACGLGTFGLSKGIITKRGMCGRLGSVLTQLDLSKDIRNYGNIHEYCTMCGACIGRCPARAISFKHGKNSAHCGDFLDKIWEKHNPRYGCGKCQTGVPCESGIPKT